jgi:protein-disulfide isomerase
MKRLLALSSLSLLLVACVDTTGISAESSKPARGNLQSVVVVTEYADLECPACRAAQSVLVQPLYDKYKSQVRFEYKHFPLRSIHRYTMDLAEGAECAADQNKFWEFADMAFEKQSELGSGSVQEWAKNLNLDMDLFTRCTDSHIKRDAIQAEYDQGIAMGVQGTPTFFVNGKQTQATIEDLTSAIDAQLKGAAQRL